MNSKRWLARSVARAQGNPPMAKREASATPSIVRIRRHDGYVRPRDPKPTRGAHLVKRCGQHVIVTDAAGISSGLRCRNVHAARFVEAVAREAAVTDQPAHLIVEIVSAKCADILGGLSKAKGGAA